MKPIFLISAVVSGCCLLLGGCAGPQGPAPAASPRTTADWKAGGYQVVFRAGPVDSATSRSYSHYEISIVPPAPVPAGTIKVESALSTDIIKEVPGTEISNQIRTFVSPSGNTLLIEEVLPVVAWPCNNWILVKREEGSLRYDYLVPPDRQVRPTDDNEEIPRVTTISDNEIGFRYSDGRQITLPTRGLVKKEKRPEFPG